MITCTHSVVFGHAEILLSGYGDSPGIPNNNKLLEYCSLAKSAHGWSTVDILANILGVDILGSDILKPTYMGVAMCPMGHSI